MSTRDDIAAGRLVYTCHCGWVDTGHSNPVSRQRYVGAQSLWEQMSSERSPWQQQGIEGYLVRYRQQMGARVAGVSLEAGEERTYFVKNGLSRTEKEAVAMAIFMEVSLAFEDMQGSWPYAWTRAEESSFSEEDLVSNLIGFYQIVRPGTDYLKLCEPVSLRSSLEVWDRDGAVGAHKNRSFFPVFHSCSECSGSGSFPAALQAIAPAAKGRHHFDWDVGPPGTTPI